jgi:hypothetical protein
MPLAVHPAIDINVLPLPSAPQWSPPMRWDPRAKPVIRPLRRHGLLETRFWKQGLGGMPLGPTQKIIGRIGHDLHQPGAEGTAAKATDILECLDEALLCGVIAERRVAEQSISVAVRHVLIHQNKLVEGVQVPSDRLVNQYRFRVGFRLRLGFEHIILATSSKISIQLDGPLSYHVYNLFLLDWNRCHCLAQTSGQKVVQLRNLNPALDS